jgi:thiol-disulfide isomerase/thioredoxin
VAAAVRDLDDLRRSAAPDFYTKRAREVMADVVRRYPNDIFANLRYLSYFHEKGHEDVIKQYRSAMDAHPHDPHKALLYAASLIGTDTPEALRRLTALAEVPDFPYPYLLIGQIRSYQKFQDHAALSTNLLKFAEACPGYLPAYELLSFAGRGEHLRKVTETLRRLLETRTDRDALVAYRWLWPLEFRVTPPVEHDALRARVEQDIASLRARYRLEDPVALETFRTGYRTSGNTAAWRALPAPVQESERVYEPSRQWYRDHPAKQNASKEEKEQQNRELAQAAQSWIAQWPDEPMPYSTRFQALAKLPQTSDGALVAAGAELIAINRKRSGRYLTTPAVIQVAQAYVNRGIRLDEVPGMLEAGVREADANRHAPESDLFDDRNHRLNEQYRYQARIEARGVEFDWALKSSKTERAQTALAAMREDLEKLTAVTTQPGYAQYLDADCWTKMARLAELEGRNEDAVRFRRTAEERRSAPRRSSDGSMVSAEGKRLPPLRATGADGRVWTPADLDGKVAVINVWATWCGPCVEELPHFQTLYEKLKDRSNIVVLTLNVDSNPGVVAPFLKGRSYTFPILLAHDYVDQFLPELGIPRNWVVEGGTIRSEQVGFSESERWLSELLSKVDEAQRRH